MKVKDIYSICRPEQSVEIEVFSTDVSDSGKIERINEVYSRYLVKKITPIWDVLAGVPRLKLILQAPPHSGRPRKKAES